MSKRAVNLLRKMAVPIKFDTSNPLTGVQTKVDDSLLNTGAAVTTTLTAAQSGTHFNIDGTDDIVVNMPALSTTNVGLNYSFMVTTAVASGKTVTFVLPGSGVSNWYGSIVHWGQTSPASTDVAGDTLTLIAVSAIGSRVSMLCVADDGTNSTWECRAESDKLATID
mgnify:CR=1 FL=1